jgi:hypothetical protein
VNVGRTALIAVLLAAVSAVSAAATTRTVPPAAPAEWRTYDVLVPLQNLPTSYSCDDLWYKFRALLLQLGARNYMTISPYQCGYLSGPPAHSPSVELKFQLPEVLHGTATRYAQISVAEKTIRLAPGTPSALQAGDCELMKQLRDLFLAALPVHVSTSAFDCTRHPHPSFALTVNASIAVPASAAGATVAANTPSSTSSSSQPASSPQH